MLTKNVTLAATVAIATLLFGATSAEAGSCKKSCQTSCQKATCCKFFAKIFPDKTVKSTKVICRRSYYKTECHKGCEVRVKYNEVTYKTTYCSGRTKKWKETTRA